jgi:hypothetical protein
MERLAPIGVLSLDFSANCKFDFTYRVQRVRITAKIKKKDVASSKFEVLLVRAAAGGFKGCWAEAGRHLT